ncbi:hypothetical protein [Streptomyces sp. enrichment culture]|uniref:hypothetical protein n=1 Tax=Streptomyces sp. enrichment culture TaxID=1795815 RepID=UPI003F561E58
MPLQPVQRPSLLAHEPGSVECVAHLLYALVDLEPVLGLQSLQHTVWDRTVHAQRPRPAGPHQRQGISTAVRRHTGNGVPYGMPPDPVRQRTIDPVLARLVARTVQ